MKYIKYALLFFLIITLVGCKSYSIKFKEEYESLNGIKSSSGKKYRELKIDSDNPIVYVNEQEALNI